MPKVTFAKALAVAVEKNAFGVAGETREFMAHLGVLVDPKFKVANGKLCWVIHCGGIQQPLMHFTADRIRIVVDATTAETYRQTYAGPRQ